MDKEIRFALRAADIKTEDNEIRVSGYAAVFNQDADIGGYFVERIEAGAFDEALTRDDVVFLINHDGLPLATTRAKTMTLSSDSHGLKMETVLDGTDPDVQRIVPKMKRGDLDKMSFAFRADVQEWNESSDPPVRTIKKASLYDVSIVTTPAYSGTEIGLRSLEAAKAEFEKNKPKPKTNAALRMKIDLDLRARKIS